VHVHRTTYPERVRLGLENSITITTTTNDSLDSAQSAEDGRL